MIKVITFDLDGVYFPNGKANFMKSITGLGVSDDEFKRVFAKSDQMNKEYKLGKLSDEQFWTWAKNEWKLSISWQEIVALMIDGYDVDENIVSIVKKCRELGYKTAICTSNFPSRINGLQKKFGFLDNFDVKVISYQIGANKPDRKIYESLVRIADVLPNEIVFADDNEESVKNSKLTGITTFFYERFDKYLKQLHEIGIVLN